jgi:type II secretory pathway pseudopilin PulG
MAVGLSALAVVVVAGIVAAVLIAAGGSPSSSSQTSKVAAQKVQLTNALLASRALYTTSQQASYSALLPAGWQPVATTNALLSDAATVQNPLDTGTTMTVGRLAKPAKTLSADAKQVIKAVSGASGFANQQSTATTLAGGRAAWGIGYTAGGNSVAYYIVQSCKNTYAVSATVPPSRASVIRPRLQIVAGTLQGNC